MADLHNICVDKSSYKAEMNKQGLPLHALTKDSFRKAYENKKEKK
ncbi:hypothetical protein [Sporolituus thermophilus]|uniref:Uncharacterized protein n=1 Tax=Sporolituus thermophilus DSM 23256 TaxID=1123285 RepID=A0A1G7L015_9FIRM|nr:hypothetical protein [Sporolituus thermophilus]SDF42872.1 hypothetical protein SAMN05660235_01564 [Sporolituus thermophilus DSM 23256]